LLLAVAWLVKSLISHYLNKDIASYKVNMAAQNAKEIEQFKHELERVANERRIMFEMLHTQRNEVISELYSRIVEFYDGIDSFVGVILLVENDEEIEKEAQKLWRKVGAFKSYAEKNRIYFSKEMCALLDQMYDIADEPTSKLMVAAEYQNIDKNGKDNLYNSWQEASKALENEVQEIRQIIENEFRNLIGVG